MVWDGMLEPVLFKLTLNSGHTQVLSGAKPTKTDKTRSKPDGQVDMGVCQQAVCYRRVDLDKGEQVSA